MRRLLAIGAFLFVPATGCVLAVPSFEHADHCTIGGATSCGRCLQQKCQAPIDACCGDLSCSGGDGHSALLDGLDECAGASTSRCAFALTGVTGPAASNVASCVTASCAAECLGDEVPPPAPWSCSETPARDLPCAKCIFQACATALGNCCGDAECSKDTVLAADVGACAGGDPPRCVYRIENGSASGLSGIARACIVDNCEVSCLGNRRPHQTCNYEAAGAYCSCSDSENASGPACPGATVGGDCVLGMKGCTCGHYACHSSSTSSDCDCAFTGDVTGNSESCNVRRSTEVPTGVCCLKVGTSGPTCSCETYSSQCFADSGESEVSSCDLEVVRTALHAMGAIVSTCSN